MDAPAFPQPRTCPYRPAPAYEQLRTGRPLERVTLYDGTTAWVVTKHAEMRAVLANPNVSSNRARPGFPCTAPELELYKHFPSMLQSLDPPEHVERRRMLIPEFTNNRIKAMTPAIEKIVDDSLARLLASDRPADLLSLYCRRIPSLVIAEILGIPVGDREFFQAVCARLSQPSGKEEVFAAYVELGTYLANLIADPPPGLLARLVDEEVAAGTLTKEDVVQNAVVLLLAGIETTASVLALSVVALLEQPEQLAAFRSAVDTSGAVEELLRFTSIIDGGVPRVATADIPLGDTTVKAGERLLMGISLVNRDPAAFTGDPDVLDIGRPAGKQLAFGFGGHQCLGHNLARLEIRLALTALLDRLPGLRLAVPASELRVRPPIHFHGVLELPVTW